MEIQWKMTKHEWQLSNYNIYIIETWGGCLVIYVDVHIFSPKYALSHCYFSINNE